MIFDNDEARAPDPNALHRIAAAQGIRPITGLVVGLVLPILAAFVQ